MEFVGFLAAFLTTVSFVPQAIKTIQTKDTQGISLMMYSLFSIGIFLWFVYGIYKMDYALMGANLLTFIFASIILSYKIKDTLKK